MSEPGAPARGLSAAELGAAVDELQPFVGSTLIDATVLRAGGNDDDLLLVLSRTGDRPAKVFLHVALGGARARVAPTERRFAASEFVTGPAGDVLKRELDGARLQHIGAVAGERRCALHFATHRGERRLVVELFGARGLWTLLDAEGRVLALSRAVATKVRDLAIGDHYVAPPVTPHGGPVERVEPVRFAAPMLAAIDRHFTALDQQHEAAAEHDRLLVAARRALQKARDKQRGTGAQLADTGRSAALRRDADMMLALAHSVARGATTMSFDDPESGEPRTIALDPARPVVVQARALYEKARRLDAGRTIAEQRLAEATAAVTALAAVVAELDAAGASAPTDLDALRNTLAGLGALPRTPGPAKPRANAGAAARGDGFRRFVSTEGYEILVGRDNQQNDRLTMRVANGNDLWLHVGGGRPGSHVVVRLPKQKTASLETLLDAAALAVHFSKARGEHRIEVVYTQRKHVRKPKGLPAGAVVPSQTRTIVSLLDEGRLRRLLDSAADPAPD